MAGAAGLVVSDRVESSLPQLLVSDTHLALKSIATFWRNKFDIPVVAVTGSNGKTTVKEMIAAIFRVRGRTLATRGNLNNDFGVPLTLFDLDPEDRYAVIEIGANHEGEIAPIVEYVKPKIALVTMIGPSHLEGFGSIEGVARAKSEIYSQLNSDGVAILNRDDAFYDDLKNQVKASKRLSFGFDERADLRGEIGQSGSFTVHFKDEYVPINLQLAGRHNQLNALAAGAVAAAAGFTLAEIRKGLETVRPVEGRLQPRPEISRYNVIDDSYNANPASMKAAIDVLVGLPGDSCLVLGDMAELGDDVELLHAEVGRYAKSAGIGYLLAQGRYMKQAVEQFGTANAVHCSTLSQLVDEFRKLVPESANVLVKGSRSAGMDRFVKELCSQGQGRGVES